MSGHAGKDMINGAWITLQISCNLAISHAANGLHENIFNEVWFFQPISNAECLRAEGAIAGQAEIPLYPAVVSLPQVGAIFLEGESFRQWFVALALRVWAVWWLPALG